MVHHNGSLKILPSYQIIFLKPISIEITLIAEYSPSSYLYSFLSFSDLTGASRYSTWQRSPSPILHSTSGIISMRRWSEWKLGRSVKYDPIGELAIGFRVAFNFVSSRLDAVFLNTPTDTCLRTRLTMVGRCRKK